MYKNFKIDIFYRIDLRWKFFGHSQFDFNEVWKWVRVFTFFYLYIVIKLMCRNLKKLRSTQGCIINWSKIFGRIKKLYFCFVKKRASSRLKKLFSSLIFLNSLHCFLIFCKYFMTNYYESLWKKALADSTSIFFCLNSWNFWKIHSRTPFNLNKSVWRNIQQKCGSLDHFLNFFIKKIWKNFRIFRKYNK